MKSFSKVLSVLVLSLFCSFFCVVFVRAATSSGFIKWSSSDPVGTSKSENFRKTSTITGLTDGYIYDVSVNVYLALAGAHLQSSTFSNLKVTDSSGNTLIVPSSGRHTYTIRITATSETYSFVLTGTASGKNNSVSPLATLDYSYDISAGNVEFVSTGNEVLDELRKQTDIQEDQLAESQKQTDAMLNFSGSADMDASKGQLDTAISDYDQIEGSLFDSGQTAFDQFDPSSLLNFSTGIYASIAYISQLMVSIISAMGEFSIIYTVGVVLVFFGMLIGLWRFFK